MTTPFSSLSSSIRIRFKFAELLWGTLTPAIAILSALSPALGTEVLTSAVPAKPALKSPTALTPQMPSGAPVADEPGGADPSVEVSGLQAEPAASAEGDRTDDTEAPVAEAPAIAQTDDDLTESEPSAGDLARQSQNPIANLISLPFQYNAFFGVGGFDRTSHVLNIQPVIPVNVSEDWLLINRTIIPLVYQPELAPGVGDVFGVGDISYQGFFSPRSSGNFTWGVGPSLVVPTATDTTLGSGKWSFGPTAVGLITSGRIVAGALVSNVWSFAGDSDRPDVNLLTLQPFFNYNLDEGWFLTTSPIISADWLADGEQWTVPIGGGVGRVFKIGQQPVSASLAAYWNAVRPEGAADWSLRAQMTLLFPR